MLLSCQNHLKKNKTTKTSIYISQGDKVGGGEVVQGEIDKSAAKESYETVILNQILEALSHGIAKSIVDAAVKSMSPIEVTYTNQGSA